MFPSRSLVCDERVRERIPALNKKPLSLSLSLSPRFPPGSSSTRTRVQSLSVSYGEEDTIFEGQTPLPILSLNLNPKRLYVKKFEREIWPHCAREHLPAPPPPPHPPAARPPRCPSLPLNAETDIAFCFCAMSDDDDDDDDIPTTLSRLWMKKTTFGRTRRLETISLQTPVSRCVRESSRDPRTDLAFERARATFRSKELETLLAGGIENVKLRKLVAETVTKDAVFGNKTSEKYSLRREELYRTTLEKYLEIPRVAREILANGSRRRYE